MAEVNQTNNHGFYTRLEAIKDEAEFNFEKVKKQFMDKLRDSLDKLDPEHYTNFIVSVSAHTDVDDHPF